MDYSKYLVENAYILIPVLYIIGSIFKDIKVINDKYIPILLLFVGIGFACAWLGLSTSSTIQGVLITGVTVYSNQIIKQLQKSDSSISKISEQVVSDKNTDGEVKIESETNGVDNTVIQNNASATMEVANPENMVEDGNTVNAVLASSPTA